MAKIIAIGADHGGFSLKEKLAKQLEKAGYTVRDAGTKSGDPCDYPLYGFEAAKMVSSGKAQKGVLICRSGIGMAIIGNKLPGVRAGVCSTMADAISSREHNDTNILVLAADRISARKAGDIMEAWLKTKTLPGRHARRVKMIKDYEKKVFKSGK